MSIFGIVLIIIIVWFVLRPIFRVWLAVHRARRRMQDFARAAGFDPTGRGDNGDRTRTAPQPQPRRKKIDPSVGEYVAFEEVSVSATDNERTHTRHKVKPESQVVDIDWEDLPS